MAKVLVDKMTWKYYSGRNGIDVTTATCIFYDDGSREITFKPPRSAKLDEADKEAMEKRVNAGRTYKPSDDIARAAARVAAPRGAARGAAPRGAAPRVAAPRVAAETADKAAAAAEKAAADKAAAEAVAADTTDSAAKADAEVADAAAAADALLTKTLLEPSKEVGPDATLERFAAMIADTMALACEFESALALLATETEAARAALDEAMIQLLIMRTTLGEVDYDDDDDTNKLILELEAWQKEDEVEGLNSRVTALYARIYEKLEAFACAEKKVDDLHALARRAAYKKKRAAEDKDKNAAALGFSRRVTGKSTRRHVPGFFDTRRSRAAYLPPMCLHIGRHDSVFDHRFWAGR